MQLRKTDSYIGTQTGKDRKVQCVTTIVPQNLHWEIVSGILAFIPTNDLCLSKSNEAFNLLGRDVNTKGNESQEEICMIMFLFLCL